MIVDDLDIATARAEEITAKIAGNDFIYITGGNTFFLLQELKRTGTDAIIVREVNAGKLYIGESAGAIIASSNIEYVSGMGSAKKAPALENYDALGLVDIYPVPHHTNAPFKKVTEKIIADYAQTLHLVPINNKSAIRIENGEFTIQTGSNV